MTARARRKQEPCATSQATNLGDEGAERYMWAFVEGEHVTLSIPGVRDMELSSDEARAIGEMLVSAASQVDQREDVSGIASMTQKKDENEFEDESL
ncbi:hypothetical protein [Amycolatopsis sp. H20-H5]|uniref:hypothetical protein n=1 Tax=Amycolatopsis sp. H20-H5 TaxID=3046309 RepID=UPI002DBC5D4C|nr:hypothetical protein [Amycolatopsis sp. H20-H5]MEC3978614.1 hypothetical protein [Amycolatopsis sp. H20-H5]